MRTSGSIEEVEVGIDRFSGARAPDDDLPFHPIDEQSTPELLPMDDAHFAAGMRRDEHFRVDPCDLDMSGVGNIHGKNAFRGSESIRIELGTFVPLADLVDDAEETHGFAMDDNLHRHKIVEL